MPDSAESPVVLVLNRDLFFGIRLNQLLKTLGYRVKLLPSQTQFLHELTAEETALGIIDIGFSPNWTEIQESLSRENLAPVIGFGPHLDVDGLRAAKLAGLRRVFSNSEFSRETAAIVRRYARLAPETGDNSD